MDTCPAQDVDVYYATVQAGDHEFCVETSNGEWVSFRLYEEGNVVPLVNRNGPRPCIQVEADEEVRYFFSVWQLGPRNRVEYEVTYEER